MYEFLFLHLITRSIKKIPKISPLTRFSKIFISLSKIFYLPPFWNILSLLSKLFLVPTTRYFLFLQVRPFFPLSCCSLFLRIFFSPTISLRFHRYCPPFSFSLLFFAFWKTYWRPLCTFKNKLRRTEQTRNFICDWIGCSEIIFFCSETFCFIFVISKTIK